VESPDRGPPWLCESYAASAKPWDKRRRSPCSVAARKSHARALSAVTEGSAWALRRFSPGVHVRTVSVWPKPSRWDSSRASTVASRPSLRRGLDAFAHSCYLVGAEIVDDHHVAWPGTALVPRRPERCPQSVGSAMVIVATRARRRRAPRIVSIFQ